MLAAQILDVIVANFLTLVAVTGFASMITAAKGNLQAVALSMYNIIEHKGFGRYAAETIVSQVFVFVVSYWIDVWCSFAVLTIWNCVILYSAYKGHKYSKTYFIEGSMFDYRIAMHLK